MQKNSLIYILKRSGGQIVKIGETSPILEYQTIQISDTFNFLTLNDDDNSVLSTVVNQQEEVTVVVRVKDQDLQLSNDYIEFKMNFISIEGIY